MDWKAENLSTMELSAALMTIAVGSLIEDESGFAPYVMLDAAGQRSLDIFPGGTVQQSMAGVKEFIDSRSDADRTAFALNGAIDYAGRTWKAIMVKSWARGAAATTMALRYEIVGRLRKHVELVGTPLQLGPEGWREPDDTEVDVTDAQADRLAGIFVPGVSEVPLANEVISRALADLAALQGPFAAFAVVQKAGERTLVRMAGDRLERMATEVREYALTRTDADLIGFAIDGFITVEGVRSDAIMLEVWDYVTKLSVRLAQRYRVVPQTIASESFDPEGPVLVFVDEAGWRPAESEMHLGGIRVLDTD